MTEEAGKRANAARRQDLLDAAVAELVEVGEAKASLRSIARRAGITHQAVRHHFASRAALFAEVAASGFHQLAELMTEAVSDPQLSPLQRVAAHGEAYRAFAESSPEMFNLMIGSNLPDRTQEVFIRAAGTTFDLLNQSVVEALAGSHLRGLDAEQLTIACWSIVHGLSDLRQHGLIDVERIDPSILEILLTNLFETSEGQLRRDS